MCLLTTTRTALIAKKNILCYKILCFNKYVNANEIYFYTPIMKKEIPKIPYTINENKMKDQIFTYHNGTLELHEISGGFIHAYHSTGHLLLHENEIYVECIIPKGTRYFVGEEGADDICAKKIKLLRIMLKEEISPIMRYKPDYYPSLPLYKYGNKTLWSEIKSKVKIKIVNFFKWLF